jgi:hypothetical protein
VGAVSLIVDIVSVFQKVSTKLDQGQALGNELQLPRQGEGNRMVAMLKTAWIAGISFLTAALGLFALYLLVALAPPIGPWSSKDEVSFWLLWGLHALVVAGSLGVGALSSDPVIGPEGESRRRPGVVGSELVALLLTPGLWTAAYLMTPIVMKSEMPEWQRRFTPGEELLAVPLTMLPVSACAAYAGQIWRRTRRCWAGIGAVVGGPLAYVVVWIADRTHSDTGVFVGLWVWPATTLLAALWASRRPMSGLSGP